MTEKHLQGPPAEAIPLLDAMKRFLPVEMWAEYDRAVEAQKHQANSPDYFSMRVREWRSAQERHDALAPKSPRLQVVEIKLRSAFQEMLKGGRLIAYAQQDPPLGPWHRLTPANWRLLQIKDAKKGTIATKSSVLFDAHIVEAAAETEVDDHMPTGMQGRRTKGRELIIQELDRRIRDGELEDTLAAQARVLGGWYRGQYPRRQAPKDETIGNNIRHRYNTARSALSNPIK